MQFIIKSILENLKFLKNIGIVHCDLKPENIVYTSDNKNIKIIDYGSATYIDDTNYWYIQTRPYRAPEVVLGCPFDYSVDMWSLGCVLYELMTGETLFH